MYRIDDIYTYKINKTNNNDGVFKYETAREIAPACNSSTFLQAVKLLQTLGRKHSNIDNNKKVIKVIVSYWYICMMAEFSNKYYVIL